MTALSETNGERQRQPGGTSQRQWQRDRTIENIERAALPVLVRLGYEATTAEHLADAANVSVRTLFRYFPSGKDDVILAELRRNLDALETRIRARPDGESLFEVLDRARTDSLSHAEVATSDASRLTAQIARDRPGLMARLLGERQLFAERLVDVFATRLGFDAATDLRPRLFAHCYVAALVTGWLTAADAPGRAAHTLVSESIELVLPLIASAAGKPVKPARSRATGGAGRGRRSS